MKKVAAAVFIICLLLNMTACKLGEAAPPSEVAAQFFASFEVPDYKAMEAFCTENCVKNYFGENEVFGMIWAKLTEMGAEKIVDDSIVRISVSAETEAAEDSAFYGETEVSFSLELINVDNEWLINGFFAEK